MGKRVVVSNTFSIWMVPGEGVLRFRESSVDEARQIISEDNDVRYWFSNERSAEKVKNVLGVGDVEIEKEFPVNWDVVIVVGGKKRVTVVERLSFVLPP